MNFNPNISLVILFFKGVSLYIVLDILLNGPKKARSITITTLILQMYANSPSDSPQLQY